MWGAVIRYECVDCRHGYQGNVGTVLVRLDPHVRQAYALSIHGMHPEDLILRSTSRTMSTF
jgi:hypothetical protein